MSHECLTSADAELESYWRDENFISIRWIEFDPYWFAKQNIFYSLDEFWIIGIISSSFID